MSDYKNYATTATLTFTGRVYHVELVDGKNGEWLSIQLIGSLQDDADPVVVQFSNNNGLMTLYKKGFLGTGRSITVTGHIAEFKETYINKKTGKRAMLQNPTIKLSRAQVFDGGLGPAKKADSQAATNADFEDDFSDGATPEVASASETADLAAKAGF